MLYIGIIHWYGMNLVLKGKCLSFSSLSGSYAYTFFIILKLFTGCILWQQCVGNKVDSGYDRIYVNFKIKKILTEVTK